MKKWFRGVAGRLRNRWVLGSTSCAAAALGLLAGLGSVRGAPEIPVVKVVEGDFLRRVSATGTLKAVKATPVTTPSGAEKPLRIAWIIEDGSEVKEGDFIARFDPTDFENDLADGRAQMETAEQKGIRSTAEGDAIQSNLLRDAGIAEKELQFATSAQKRDPRIFSRKDIVKDELDLDLAKNRMEYSKQQVEIRKKLVSAEEGLLEIERRKAGLTISQAEQGLKSLEVRAPHAGFVMLERDWRGNVPRVGDVRWPGSKLGEIPEMGAMEAEIYVLEADAGGLAKGKRATVVLDAEPGREIGAEVSKVDPLAKPRIPFVPVQYFGATLSLKSTPEAKMKPGERISTTVVLEEIRNAIMIPREAVFESVGKKVVYKKGAWGRFTPVEVSLGSADLGRVVVLKGVEAGEKVALADPTRKAEEPKKGEGSGPATSAPPVRRVVL